MVIIYLIFYGETSHIYNTFDTIVKNKYDLRNKS